VMRQVNDRKEQQEEARLQARQEPHTNPNSSMDLSEQGMCVAAVTEASRQQVCATVTEARQQQWVSSHVTHRLQQQQKQQGLQ
jgi:hypothetical protein